MEHGTARMLGDLLRRARGERGLGVGQTAARLGVSKSMVSTWETGVHQPSPERLLDLLGVLRADPDVRRHALELRNHRRAFQLADLPSGDGLADALRSLRQRAGYTQEDAARLLNVSQPTLSRWEEGESEPGAEARRRMRDAYGLSESESRLILDLNSGETPLWLRVSEARSVPTLDEIVPVRDERLGLLQLLSIGPVVRRRAATDARWADLNLDLAFHTGGVSMAAGRYPELWNHAQRRAPEFRDLARRDPRAG